LQRPAQGIHQPVHECHDIAEIGDIHEGDGELVGTEARDQIVFAQSAFDAGADVAENLVAARMICGFVDLLELIDIEAEHGDMRALPMHALHGLGEGLAEGLAIGEAGEIIVPLEIVQLLLGLAALTLPHPSEGAGQGDTGAEQEQGNGRHQIEIAGEHRGLFALVERDDERAAWRAVECKRKRQGGEVRGGCSGRALIQRDLGSLVGRACEQGGEVVV
jgi:hypothetical protein